VRPPSQSDSRVATRGHFTVPVHFTVRSIAIAASSVMDLSPDSFVLMFWDFYLPLIGESVVSRGCSRLEERGSIYLVNPIAIIEV
jgi:hypothetical protein